MFNTLVESILSRMAYIRGTKRARFADKKRHLYETIESDQIEHWQLARFNRCWKSMVRDIPSYREALAKKQVPDVFTNWDSFVNALPLQNRSSLSENIHQYVYPTPKADFWRITGGSTGTPLRLPAWKSERVETEANEWLARSWLNISPTDPSMRIWGHSHGLGSGVRGKWNRWLRARKDTALGIHRVSAYDLSHQAFLKAGEKLKTGPYVYLLGYSKALAHFGSCMKQACWMGKPEHLTHIIATAESFSHPESDIRDLETVFGCPVEMEYGSVETHTLAQTRGGGKYHILWDSYWIEALETDRPQHYRILVTSLYPRACPLVRYDLGDIIIGPDQVSGTRSFAQVTGRSNDLIRLLDGTRIIHSEAISHAVSCIQNVRSFQFIIDQKASLNLHIATRRTLSLEEKELLRSRLSQVHPELAECRISEVCLEDFKITPAGKRPQIWDDRIESS